MLSDKQLGAFHQAITEYGSAFAVPGGGSNSGERRVEIIDLVSSWLDQAVAGETERCARVADNKYETELRARNSCHPGSQSWRSCERAGGVASQIAAELRAGKERS